jgi:hypothetical protein
MFKKRLFLILICVALIVSTFFSFNGSAGLITAATTKYTIVALAGPGGTISPSGLLLVNSGTNKNFTIRPGNGFHIADVLVDGASVGRPTKYTFPNVTSNHRILALFASSLVINAGAGPGGKIDPSGPVVINLGKNATFTITPDPGYYAASLLIDGVRVVPTSSFTFKGVKAPHSIMATFNNVYPILGSASPGGSIDPSGVVMVESGNSATFNMTADTGYHLVDVRVDGLWVGPQSSYTFPNVTDPHDIMAVFSDEYHVIARAGTGGTISPSGVMAVVSGTSLEFTISPKNGYALSDVLVNGESKESEVIDGKLTVQISEPTTVVALFVKGSPTAEELQEYQEYTEE